MDGAQEEREGEGEAGSRVGPLAPGFAKGRVGGHGQPDVRASRGLLPRQLSLKEIPSRSARGVGNPTAPFTEPHPLGPAQLACCRGCINFL